MIKETAERASTNEKETGRLEAFSDGVFAVAITLLVFNLMSVPQPDAGKIFLPEDLARALFHQWASYLAFLISFATILIMWINHHGIFKLVHKSDTQFMFVNGFLLLLVTLVPFPTALVAEYLTQPAAKTACVVYAGLFVVINIAYNLLWWSASHQRRLLRPDISSTVIKRLTISYLFGFPSYMVALIAAFLNPLASVGICGALWIFWAVTMYETRSPRKL